MSVLWPLKYYVRDNRHANHNTIQAVPIQITMGGSLTPRIGRQEQDQRMRHLQRTPTGTNHSGPTKNWRTSARNARPSKGNSRVQKRYLPRFNERRRRCGLSAQKVRLRLLTAAMRKIQSSPASVITRPAVPTAPTCAPHLNQNPARMRTPTTGRRTAAQMRMSPHLSAQAEFEPECRQRNGSRYPARTRNQQ